ncbi:MAG TPA: DUF4416 family protein [bacterium]|nr:DUF4416 family protein [bacterium]
MGSVREVPRAWPLLAVFAADPLLLRAEADRWLAAYGGPLAQFGPYPFSFSAYYDAEMGNGLQKLIVVGSKPVAAETLAAMKGASNRREAELAAGGRRTINLDPGLLDAKRLVLATTKDAAHRICVRDGIFAEVTLRYHHGSYQAESWTYPDFRQAELQAWLTALRPTLLARGE